MDFSKLSSNDKLAVIGAGLAIVGALLAFGGGGSFGLLLSTAGGLLMGWASWKEFQAEGGKFNVGMASSAPTPPPAAPPAPPAAPMSEPMSPPMSEPMSPPPAAPMSQPMDSDRSENDPQP